MTNKEQRCYDYVTNDDGAAVRSKLALVHARTNAEPVSPAVLTSQPASNSRTVSFMREAFPIQEESRLRLTTKIMRGVFPARTYHEVTSD